MKQKLSFRSLLFAFLGIMIASGVILLCLTGGTSEPVMLGQPAQARACVEAFSRALSDGDMTAASRCLYTSPELTGGELTEPAGILWQKFLNNLECSFDGTITPTAQGLKSTLQLRTMDLNHAVEEIGPAAQELAQQMEKDRKNVRDADGAYTREFLYEVLNAAAEQLTPVLCEERVDIGLVRDGDSWKIFPDADLMRVLSGGLN